MRTWDRELRLRSRALGFRIVGLRGSVCSCMQICTIVPCTCTDVDAEAVEMPVCVYVLPVCRNSRVHYSLVGVRVYVEPTHSHTVSLFRCASKEWAIEITMQF